MATIISTPLYDNVHEIGIFKLPPELFWHIFMINADLEVESSSWGQYYRNEKDSPLNTTRLTSQVCLHWRKIILGSSIIWANIVELQVLRQKSDLWRKEVLKRTGTATICIRGDVRGDDEISTSFFFFLLSDYWERIRSFDVSILDFRRLDLVAWNALKRPAPNLEIFRLFFPTLTHLPLTHLPVELLTTEDPDDFFSGQVPSMREFHCSELAFSVFSSWIPQLCSITVSRPQSVSDLFSLLGNMPLLESLTIQETVVNLRDTDGGSRICVPALKRIDLKHKFRICLLILERVIPSPQCALCVSAIDPDLRGITTTEISRMQAVLTRYAEGSSCTAIKKLLLHARAEVLTVSAPTDTPLSPEIFYTEVRSSLNLPLDVFPSFLGSLSSCNFSSVTVFQFIVYPGFPLESILPIFSLPSVEILHVNKNAIPILRQFPKGQQHQLFPLLHTLILRDSEWEELDPFVIKYYSSNLSNVVDLRMDERVLIKVVDLTQCPVDNLDDLKFLEQRSGLKVRWMRGEYIEEYICGSQKISFMRDLRTRLCRLSDALRVILAHYY